MKYTYDKKDKTLTLDGEANLIISKNPEYGIYLNDDIVNNDDFHTVFINHFLISSLNSFRGKWSATKIALKYIWR